MYELGEVRKIKITDMGEETIHFLKEPSGPDWLRYQRQIAQMNGGDSDRQTTDFAIKIYDAYVDRVENYSFKGKPLMKHKPDGWKALIPEHHKVLVALELVNGRVLQKNS